MKPPDGSPQTDSTTHSLRVLQVITDTDRRGAQVFAMDLGRAMTAHGHNVRTVALAAGETVPSLDVCVLGPSRRSLRTLRALRRRMKDVDITIAHGSATGLACALAGFGPGRRFVYRQISDTRFWANSIVRRLRVAAYLRCATVIVALSEGAKTDLTEHLRHPGKRIVVVPNGVPLADFRVPTPDERAAARAALGLAPDAFVATYVGALVPEKGVDVAIAALAESEFVLLIAGTGPDRSRLELLPGASRPTVRFVGGLDRPFDAYAASDVVLLPSKGGDSMPATLIEAGFCGIPAVSTPIGSITDIVLQDRTGVVVAPGDVAGLRSAVDRLASNSSERHMMGAAARQHCLSMFEIDVVADGWVRVLSCARSPSR
jgi:glycosyltransferase involved in cell wall biosynthesis